MGVAGDMDSGAGESLPSQSSGDVDFSGMDSYEDGEQDFGELSAGVERDAPPAQTDGASATPPAQAHPEAGAAPQKADATQLAPEPAKEQKLEAAAPASQQKDSAAAKPAETAGAGENQSELDKFLSDVTQNEAAFAEHLATTQFKLSPEMVQALADGQGETAVPKIVAGAALWAVKASTNILQKTIPSIIQREVARITQEQAQRKASEDKFFAKWPQLERDKHFADIQQISNAFYAANPKMSFDELVALTGAAVMAKHGIVAQAAVQTPMKPNEGGSFVPAAGARVVGQQALQENPFAGLAGDYED